MLDIYTWEANANSGNPLLCLKETGVAFTYHYIDIPKRGQHSLEYPKINSKGTVQALVHTGLVLTKSSSVLEHIDEVFEGQVLTPSRPSLAMADAQMDSLNGSVRLSVMRSLPFMRFR